MSKSYISPDRYIFIGTVKELDELIKHRKGVIGILGSGDPAEEVD